MSVISSGIRRKAKRKGIAYEFLFMKVNGRQLEEITKFIESGIIKVILDKVYPFEQTNEALEYIQRGHAEDKVIVKIKE
ncbi:zinc-binding dehydrogenase [uncultured Dysgonomonas sp.]|uniref:Zinc-containing alcohol dehydrogenase n=1 Tax=uncultured Dysgonomonas sp. TaxID=206096 RepID=A0A212JDE1_9BACT